MTWQWVMTPRAPLVALFFAFSAGLLVFLAQGPDPAEVAAACRASARVELEQKVERAIRRQGESSPSAGFEELVGGREELLSLSAEATRLGATQAGLEAESAGHSADFVARIQRAQAQLLRESRRRLDRAESPTRAAEVLGALPQAFRELEAVWLEAQLERVQAWRALAADCERFAQARNGHLPGTTELREARTLLLRATRAGLGTCPEARALEDWIRRQAGLSLTVLREEIALRNRGRQAEGEAARRLLESLESDLGRFFAAHPRDTGRLLGVLPSEDLRGFLNAYARPELWEALAGEDWFPALERARRDRVALFELVPTRKWSEVPAGRLAEALTKIGLEERIRCTLALPAACVRRFELAELRAILRDWPARFRALVIRLLPRELAQALDPSAPPRSLSIGSGFYVTPQLVLTNAHVVGAAETVQVDSDAGGESSPGQVIARAPALDLALVRVARAGTPLRSATSANGRSTRFYGFGAQGPRSGEARVVGADLSLGRLAFSGDVEAGDSGGPLLDGAGSWIGVVTAKCVREPGREPMALAVPAESCLAWLRSQGVHLELGSPAPAQTPARERPLPSLVRLVVRGPGAPVQAPSPQAPRGESESGLESPQAALRLYLQVVSRRAPTTDLDRVLNYPALLAEVKKRHPATQLNETTLASSLHRELEGPAGAALTPAQIEALVAKARLEVQGDEASLTFPGALEYRLRRGAAGWQIVYFPS